MKLYLVHCGYYDLENGNGIYESHTNLFVAASSFEAARIAAKELPEFKARKMHVDGLQEIELVSGYRVNLDRDLAHTLPETRIHSFRQRDLAIKLK